MMPQLEPAGIQLNLEIPQSAWIKADTQQLKQVLINLVQNSAESIQNNGVITLRLKRTTADLGDGPRPAAILSVIDTGKGIPPEVQKRLFDPFFTTKEGGTGLGLAIAARIVEKHGGLMQYKTGVNRGTTFEITLARLEDDAGENSAH
jgi:signal transduction histidine kinase